MDIDQGDGPPPGEIFDEAWYLSEYPAIAKAVRDGGFRSGWQHYLIHGRHEGRLPAPLTQIAQFIATGSMRQPDGVVVPPFWKHNGAGFLTPEELQITSTEPDRIAVIGQRSLAVRWLDERAMGGCSVDMVAVDAISPLPERTAAEIASYAFVVVHISLRELIEAHALSQVPYSDLPTHSMLFHRVCELLEFCLLCRMRWNLEQGALTFVTNFFVPQNNPMGRLFPRYDLRNPEYFVNELNRHLEITVRQHPNAFVLDLDRLAASVGRRFVQDDLLFPMEYDGVLPFACAEPEWIGPLASISQHYDTRTGSLFPNLVWSELLAMYRTLCKADSISLVVVEVVDTLWKSRGGAGTVGDGPVTDGWPAGITEALVYLRKRGIQLAIISNNDEQFVREIWQGIFGRGLRIEDFAAIRINWRPKPENMGELLHDLNLPSSSVLYIDADPAERKAMQLAFQDMRILGGFPYYLRRTLLWSSETQVSREPDGRGNHAETIRAPVRVTQGAMRLPPIVTKFPPESKQPALDSLRRRLDQLWSRAMDNDITPEEAREIQRLGMAIAVTDHSIRRVHPNRGWVEQ